MFGEEEGTPSPTLATHLGPEAQYLQDWNLWRDVEDEIRAVFAPSSNVGSLDHLLRPILSVHVRRGDNVYDPGVPNKHLYMPIRPTEYYLSALSELRPADGLVLCFSDDPAWCKANIPADAYGLGDARPKDGTPEYWTADVLDYRDLFFMAACDLHVLSASSFAWWGAFLSEDPSPIYPAQWYGPALAHIDTSLMFPPGWREWPSCF